MKADRSELIDRKRRLPDLIEPLLRPGRAAVAILPHHHCEDCQRYLESLNDVLAELASWDADVTVITPQPLTWEPLLRCLIDADGAFASEAGISAPAVVIVDQWRDIKDVREAGETHDFPNPDELVSWARFLATQCPECEGEAL
jgi:hypothetical protein